MTKVSNEEQSNNANVLLCAVFKAISITPTEDEMQFVETIINGGKTDNTERRKYPFTYVHYSASECPF